MSLGWQTESALLPSKAKPINVDAKSLLNLKAVVYDQEKALNTTKSSKYVKNSLKEDISFNKKIRDPFQKSNAGIEDRIAKDKRLESSQRKTDSMIEASLRAKAKLYDQIANGQISKSTGNAFLINFDEKQKMTSKRSFTSMQTPSGDEADDHSKKLKTIEVSSSSIRKDVHSSGDSLSGDEFIDIIDDFGRSRSVSKSSEEYTNYLVQMEAMKYKKSLVANMSSYCESRDSGNEEKGNNQWAWSTGHDRSDAGDWIEETIRERGAKALVEDRIERETSLNLSSGAKVKTMWEKTLNSSARDYIEEIHNKTEIERKNQIQNTDGGDIVKADEAEDRKAMLRRKLEEKRKSAN